MRYRPGRAYWLRSAKHHAVFGAVCGAVLLVLTVAINYFTTIDEFGPGLKISAFAVAIYLLIVATYALWMLIVWAATIPAVGYFAFRRSAFVAILLSASVGSVLGYFVLSTFVITQGFMLTTPPSVHVIAGVLAAISSTGIWYRLLRSPKPIPVTSHAGG